MPPGVVKTNKEWDPLKPLNKWTKKLGQVQDIMSQPCTPSEVQWFFAFWVGVPYAVWSLFKPDPIDQTRSRFGLKHKSSSRFKMTGVEAITAKEPHPKGWGYAQFDQAGRLAERIGWWMLIVDVSLDHAINWSSHAMEWAGCNDHLTAHAIATAGLDVQGSGSPGYNRWTCGATHNMSCGPTGFFVPPFTQVQLAADLSWMPAPETPDAVMSGVTIYEITSGVDLASGNNINDASGIGGTAAARYQTPFTVGGSQSYGVKTNVSGGFVLITGGTFVAQGSTFNGLKPDP